MTDTIQTRIQEYLWAENDEDHRKLLRDAMDRIIALESGKPPLYRAPHEAWNRP